MSKIVPTPMKLLYHLVLVHKLNAQWVAETIMDTIKYEGRYECGIPECQYYIEFRRN